MTADQYDTETMTEQSVDPTTISAISGFVGTITGLKRGGPGGAIIGGLVGGTIGYVVGAGTAAQSETDTDTDTDTTTDTDAHSDRNADAGSDSETPSDTSTGPVDITIDHNNTDETSSERTADHNDQPKANESGAKESDPTEESQGTTKDAE